MMHEKFEEFLRKPHITMEDLMYDLMDIDLYVEDDNEDQNTEEKPDDDKNADVEEPETDNNSDDEEPENIDNTDPVKQSSNDLDMTLDDTPDDELDSSDEIPEDSEDEEQEQEKDRFLYNIRQLIKIRDLLNVAINKTGEAGFSKLLKYLNRILSTVASIGDDMYERDDLVDINEKLELFMNDIVQAAKKILANYEKDDEESDEDNTLDFDFLDPTKGGN
jgi:hypothetical protein